MPRVPLLHADTLIRRLLDHEHEAVLVGDAQVIAGHVGRAPFSQRFKIAGQYHFGIVGEPRPSGGGIIREDTVLTSLEAHLAKRIYDEEWRPGATTADYLADLHAAALHPDATVALGYELWGRSLAGEPRYLAVTITESTAHGLVLRGARAVAGESLAVFYEVGEGLVSGYMVETYDALALTDEWEKPWRLVAA